MATIESGLRDTPVAVRGSTLAVLLLSAACASPPASTAPTAPTANPPAVTGPPARVLMLTATAGFRHESIVTARQVMASLAALSGEFTVTATEDVGLLTTANLAAFDVVFFALTSGELPLSTAQKAALLDFVNGGKGFMGAHSATDTLYEWADYGRLVGAYFREHPWTQSATVVVEDTSHPAASGIGERFAINEEFYTFRDNPRPRVQVLLRLDAASVAATGDFPLAWSQSFGSGRAYYNALGHFDETWNDQRFQRQLLGAIRWVSKRQ
jgi:type 1 glutamine amidotransferase